MVFQAVGGRVESVVALFEDRLRPKVVASPWRRDVLAMGVLLVLAAVLLPRWAGHVGPLFSSQNDAGVSEHLGNIAYYLNNIPGQMTSIYLLLALGFALALRCGAIDLSVWAVAVAGGVAAATLMNLGVFVPVAFAAAGILGAAVGALNGWLVTRARLPSFLVTAGVAIGLTLLVVVLAGAGPVVVSRDSFAAIRDLLPFPPLLTGRMLVVAGLYSLVMMSLVVADFVPRQSARPDRQRELLAALVASGGLAGLGGACWLIDHPSAPVETWPLGDLRVVAAAVLAGGALVGGRGRTMLVGLVLPAALLTATVWRQRVELPSFRGVETHYGMLICMTIVAHLAINNALSWRQGGKKLAAAALTFVVCGMALLAATGQIPDLTGRRTFLLAAMGIWLLGAVALVISRARLRPTWASDAGRGDVS